MNSPVIRHIHPDVNWSQLSWNPAALWVLERNMHRIDWVALAHLSNLPDAVYLMRRIDIATLLSNLRPGHYDFAHLSYLATSTCPDALTLLKDMLECVGPRYVSSNTWMDICANPASEALLQRWPQMINWSALCTNPAPFAEQLLAANPHNIDWATLCTNSARWAIAHVTTRLDSDTSSCEWMLVCMNRVHQALALDLVQRLLRTHARYMDWSQLSGNRGATRILAANLHRIDWTVLARGHRPDVVPLFAAHPDKLPFGGLCSTQSADAIALLSDHLDKVDWQLMSCNPHPAAVKLLEEHLDKVDWVLLSANAGAVQLLRHHLTKVCWVAVAENNEGVGVDDLVNDILASPLTKLGCCERAKCGRVFRTVGTVAGVMVERLSSNPAAMNLLVKLDYMAMKAKFAPLADELAAAVFHPARLQRMADAYGYDVWDVDEMY